MNGLLNHVMPLAPSIPLVNQRLRIASLVLKVDEPTRPGESFPDWLERSSAHYEMFCHVLLLVVALYFCLDGTACVDVVAGIIAVAKGVQVALFISGGPDGKAHKWMLENAVYARYFYGTYGVIIASFIAVDRQPKATSFISWNPDNQYRAEFHVCQMRDESGFQKVLDSGFYFMISLYLSVGFAFGLRKINVHDKVNCSYCCRSLVCASGAVAGAMLFARASPKQNWTSDFHLQIPALVFSITAFYGAILCSRFLVWYVWFPHFIEASQIHEMGPKQVSASGSGSGTGNGDFCALDDAFCDALLMEPCLMSELSDNSSYDTIDDVLDSHKSSDSNVTPLFSAGPQTIKLPTKVKSELSWDTTWKGLAGAQNKAMDVNVEQFKATMVNMQAVLTSPAEDDMYAVLFEPEQVPSDDFSWHAYVPGNPTQPASVTFSLDDTSTEPPRKHRRYAPSSPSTSLKSTATVELPHKQAHEEFAFISAEFDTIKRKTEMESKAQDLGLSMAKSLDSVALLDNAGNIVTANPDFMFLATQIGTGRQCENMAKLGNMMAKLIPLVHENQATMEFDEISENKEFHIWGTVTRVGENTMCTIQKYLTSTVSTPTPSAFVTSTSIQQHQEVEMLIDEAMIENYTAAPGLSWATYKQEHKIYKYQTKADGWAPYAV